MDRELVIIGGGPSGLAAAVEARRMGIEDILILERDKNLGGILQQCIHSGFGLHTFKEQLTGPEYAYKFIELINKNKIEYKLNTMVLEVSKDKTITAINSYDGLFTIKPKAIIFAMGCRERTRGALNIPGTRPAGIFTAGAAQRFVNIEGFMVGKKIVILGSGDIGLIMARRMTLEGAEVLMVLEVMPYSTGLKRNIVQCLDDFNIPLQFNHTVTKVHGGERLNGVTIARVDENRKPIRETEKFVECDTLLLSVGLIPENELSRSADIKINSITGGLFVDESMQTSNEGMFACGNVVHVHDLVDFVTEESCLAGRGAAKYLKKELNMEGKKLNTTAGVGIRYVVPNIINIDNIDNAVKFFMRVDNVYNRVKLTVKAGDNVLYKAKKAIVSPGEMENVILEKSALSGLNVDEIIFSIEEA